MTDGLRLGISHRVGPNPAEINGEASAAFSCVNATVDLVANLGIKLRGMPNLTAMAMLALPLPRAVFVDAANQRAAIVIDGQDSTA